MFKEPKGQETKDGIFIRRDFPTVMSGWVVRYNLKGDWRDAEINASRDGWSVSGSWPIMTSRASADAFQRTIDKAFLIYRALNGRGAKNPLPEETVERLVDQVKEETTS